MDPDPGSTFCFSRPCPPYSMIVDRTRVLRLEMRIPDGEAYISV
jgi:hypothetical protein